MPSGIDIMNSVRIYGQHRQKKSHVIMIVEMTLAIFSLLYTMGNNYRINSIYRTLWSWPLFFLLYFIIVYNPFLKIREDHKLSINLITLFQLFPRYVLYPFLIANTSSNYIGVQHFENNPLEIERAIFYGCFEIISLALFIFILEKSKHRPTNDFKKSLYLAGNKLVYFSYILPSLGLYFLLGYKYHLIQFIKMETGYADIGVNIYLTLLRYILSIALCITTLILIAYFKKKYNRNNRKVYAYLAIASAIVYSSFIIGESRSTQLAIGLLMYMILVVEFPQVRNTILVSICMCMCAVILSITVFRTGGNVESIFNIESLADKLQVYFGGPISLAQSISVFRENKDITIQKAIFDYVRSCFPFNLFLKNIGYTTSQLYNLALYSGMSTHGHVVFGLSYGYIYLGLFGIPINLCINYYLTTKANELFFSAKSYEVKYLSGYCMIRFISATLVNTPTILGSVTQYIGTFGLLVFVSKILKKRKIKIYHKTIDGKINLSTLENN